jgi:integral membrane protein
MVKLFKVLCVAEALSLLTLFFIAMPMKYIGHDPHPVRVVGMIHGVLFVAYMCVALVLSSEDHWPKKLLLICALLASVPLGTFVFEKKFRPKPAH